MLLRQFAGKKNPEGNLDNCGNSLSGKQKQDQYDKDNYSVAYWKSGEFNACIKLFALGAIGSDNFSGKRADKQFILQN